MATIKSAIALYDGVTGPLQSMHKAMNIVINSFETMQNTSGNAVDVTAIQQAREELAKAGAAFDTIENEIRQADQAQQQFNNHINAASPAADALGGKLKGILATVASIAGIKGVLGWVKENLELADTQRNAENQLRAVLANMGVGDVEIPVTTNTQAVDGLNAYAESLEALNGVQVENTLALDDSQAMAAVGAFSGAVAGLDGSAYETTLTMDTGAAAGAVADYAAYLEQLDGTTIRTAAALDVAPAMQALIRYRRAAAGVDGAELENSLTLDTAQAAEAYDELVAAVDGAELENSLLLDTTPAMDDLSNAVSTMTAAPVVLDVQANTAQTMNAFDAIAAKASEIQSRGIYGDEAMLAGAAEFATYFSDAEAIMSMMDTLADYAMGMSGGGALDSKAMTDYATNLGKIMTGAYDAMTKKGFQFTDAQKAIIEGTATQAQIVETLGAEYVDMSADMQAAAAINSVIAESWDGLYETMSNTPEGKIIQLQNKFGDLREEIGNRLYGSVLSVLDAFDSRWGDIETLMYNLAYAAGVLVSILGTLAGWAIDVATFFTENWSWIEPIVWGIVGAFLAYNAILTITNGIQALSAAYTAWKTGATWADVAATTTATGAQVGYNAALLACPVFWIVAGIMLIIAAIVAVMRAMDVWGAKTHSVVGTITGIFTVAAAFVGNLFVALINAIIDVFVVLWNFIASFANFFANVFNDPVGAICRLFFDLADTVLSILEALASAIDTIFGSNLSGAVAGWRDSLGGWVESTFGSGAEVMAELDASDLHLGRFEYGAAFELGANFGDGISDSLGGLFNLDGVDTFDMGNTWDGLYDAAGGIDGSSGDTAANTAAMSDQLNYMDEDLKYMRDIAEREAINRFTTAEITVQQENTNYIDRDTDIDGIMDAWAADFAEKLDVSAEGVHD